MNDQSRPELADAWSKEHEPRLACARQDWFQRMTQKAGEVDHPIEIAAYVGNAQVPRLGQWHACGLRYGDHLAGVRQADQPLLARAGESEPRLLDLSSGLRGEPGGQLLLEGAQIELRGTCHRNPRPVNRKR